MNLLSPTWTSLLYLVAAVCFILALRGLSSPRTARRGNLIGAFGALVAMVTVFLSTELDNLVAILIAIAVGTVVAVPVSRRVKMTGMPQLVALFNGVGGGAAALVALLELEEVGADRGALLAIGFTVLVGAVSFSGSVVTFLKLQELMTTRPVLLPGQRWLMIGALVASLGAGRGADRVRRRSPGRCWLSSPAWLSGSCWCCPSAAPTSRSSSRCSTPSPASPWRRPASSSTTSCCWSRARWSARRGTILTRAMASAMGRSVSRHPVRRAQGRVDRGVHRDLATGPVRSSTAEDVAILLGYAQSVVVVPGYGLAVAQAQHTMAELAAALEARGTEVVYGIHPVAGRMPGHMNVLLAEANVPYEVLAEMDEVNPRMRTADVALVVGANDVVNPAAKTSPGSPIYGMPILDVDQAKQVVFLKRSMRPGFAGIENELLYEPQTTLLFGDAKDSLTKVLAAVKAL